jgi:hypothetical protein
MFSAQKIHVKPLAVTPAEAVPIEKRLNHWMPAFAGMTGRGVVEA